MRRLDARFLPLWLCAVSSGCATLALDMAPERADRPWTPAVTATGEIEAGKRGTAAADTGYVLPSNRDLAVLPSPFPGDDSKVYSLPDLIDIAESKNPLTRVAWNDARRVALAAGIAQSTYLPRLAASAVGGYETRSGRQSALGVGVNDDGSGKGTVSALSLEWLLFDFGERAALVDAAKQASVVSNVAFTAAHQEVIHQVSLAFYAHAAARARAATAEQSLKDARTIEMAAESRRDHGLGTIVEVAQARQARAQAEFALVEATGAVEDQYLALVSALGISPLTRLRIADVSDRSLSADLPASVETVVSEALSRRPDMLGARAAEKASRSKIDAARADFLPKVFVSATGAYGSGDIDVSAVPTVGEQPPTVNLSSHHLTGRVLAGVTVPLYDGGTRAARLEQAKADADNASAHLEHVREEAIRKIVVAHNTLRTSLSAYQAAEALTQAAQTTFDAALAAYEHGVGSITEVTLAETGLLQARNTKTGSYSAALSAAATLALATGEIGARATESSSAGGTLHR